MSQSVVIEGEVPFNVDEQYIAAGNLSQASGGMFVCHTCGNIFTDVDSLRTHQSEHEITSMLLSLQQTSNVVGLQDPLLTTHSKRGRPRKNPLPADDVAPAQKRAKRDTFIKDTSMATATMPPNQHDISAATASASAAVHLVGGSCIYCGFEIKKPWDLVTHMVEQHDVQISNLSCGDVAVDCNLACTFCGVIFTVAHDLFYHLLIGHARQMFGKEAVADACIIEMLTSDGKKLTLKVRINRNGLPPPRRMPQTPATAPRAPMPAFAPRVSSVSEGSLAGFSGSALSRGAVATPVMKYRLIPQPVTVQEALRNVVPWRPQLDDGNNAVSDEMIAEAESHVRLHNKGYQCEFCYKIRVSREDAVAHVYKCHLTTRKHQCPQCPKNYDSVQNLQMHMNACHTSERLYQCPNCPMKYKYPSDLKRHTSKKLCERYRRGGYMCPRCGLMWYHQSALASHQRQCEGIRADGQAPGNIVDELHIGDVA